MNKKIAAITEDRIKISSHFGRAPLYMVYMLQDGVVIGQEERAKPYHGAGGGDHHAGGHLHDDMFAPIADCQTLICGGMGEPAYARAQAAGLEIVLAGGELENVIQSYLKGELQSDLRRVHHH